MRSLSASLGLILTLVSSQQAIASMRVTDISGREVTINRGPVLNVARAAAAPRRAGPNAAVTVTAGADTDAANNDFRRIQNALNAAGPGDVITLSGTFDFTAPFAAAAWALGNDNTAATADDYSVYVPVNLNGVTLTATSLGSATIQGPGDLAGVNLEGFLLFDGGDNQNWTISNLRILDFDLAIGMFFGAGGSDAFNGTVITNNNIRIPTDLNATVAPADTNQNIGIHFSFGLNQTISNNVIDIPGDGVSDGGTNFSSTVGMQSNTSGGAVYDGLLITLNQIVVANAQSAFPQNTLGIWENGHAHLSDITVSSNQFINNAAGNDPALNLERGFRVTSHSGVATTVAYNANQVTGANIGFQWLAASNFSGNQAVLLTNNTVTNCATGVLVQSIGTAHLEQNDITGSGAGAGVHVITGTLTGAGANTNSLYRNKVSGGSSHGVWIEATAGAIAPIAQNDLGGNTGFGLRNDTAPSILAELNWWGSNLAASVAAEVSGPADFDPWLASGTDQNVPVGFQPFLHATTSGALTTFLGTGGADTASLLAGDPVTMTMNGETAFTALAQLLNFDIQMGGSDDVFTLGQTGIPTVFDGGAGNDTLAGTNVAQTWNITGAGAGNIPGATSAFSAVERLRGGTAADSFIFSAAGSIPLTVDGNLGIDTLDNSAIPAATVTPTGPGTLDGFMGTATGIGVSFDNINAIANLPADLAVTKSGPGSAVAVGATITYTITVTNGGPNAAINAALSDTLPAGTTFNSFTSAAGWSCTTPAVNGTGTVNCTRLSVPLGPHVFTLVVNAPAAPGPVSNTATVTAANDSNGANNSSMTTTTVSVIADLAVTKTATPAAATGTNVTYNITLTNNGPNDAPGVSLSDTIPANTTFVSTTQNTGPLFSCTNPSVGGTGTVNCTLASLTNGTSATFTIVVNVSPSAPAGPLNNTASATTTGTDPNPGNSTSTASTAITIALSDLSITKVAAAGPYLAAVPITYTITVNNGGPGLASGVVVTDVLPAGSTFNSATPSQGSCSGTTTVTCNLGTLANAASATISLQITPTAAGPFSNTATVTNANGDGNAGNNSSTSNVTVDPNPAIPALPPSALLLLAVVLAIGGFVAVRSGS